MRFFSYHTNIMVFGALKAEKPGRISHFDHCGAIDNSSNTIKTDVQLVYRANARYLVQEVVQTSGEVVNFANVRRIVSE